MVQHVGDVFHDDSYGCAGLHITKIFDVEPRARVMAEGFRVLGNLAEFGAPHAGERLTGRAADQDVKGVHHIAQSERLRQRRGRCLCNVTRYGVTRIPGMEVGSMGTGGVGIELDRSGDLIPCGFEAQGKAPTPREQVKHPGLTTCPKPLDLPV
jgi:hypothetical protein